ncbi:Uncharacterised protein [Capnocytophaga ochracea]|uniref:Uncharacterized protein n=1 Tax=Capnocytophaga ochracea TaxID=1018 RepID=A0A2X1HJE5_CAPOC|nr:Uncharacterised protein [Capnocytophaga ochracea]
MMTLMKKIAPLIALNDDCGSLCATKAKDSYFSYWRDYRWSK